MSFGWAATCFCWSLILELVELPLPPKKLPRRMSPIPVEPEPTPKATKPIANASARRTYITFACRRRREKKSCSSQLGAARCFFFACGCACRLRCAWAAPRAIGVLGYLVPGEVLSDSAETRLRL